MSKIIFLLSLKPIIYGLIGMILSGVSFPLAGVIIMQNGLVPLRYMLMHGVMLGGIFSIAFRLPVLPVSIAVNILLVIVMMFFNNNYRQRNLLVSSSTMMVITMGLASLMSHIFNIPAQDTLDILWGSPFALTTSDILILSLLTVFIITYVTCCFRKISMLFFDKDIALSMNVNVKFHSFLMVFISTLVVSAAMKIIGALLIDALVILPVNIGIRKAKSLKALFIRSSLTGTIISVTAYFISLAVNLPVSGVMALLASLYFGISCLLEKIGRKK
ncbi:MAG: metal ABC transporter permease [Sphaerochaetaceae bacterium]|nr:metal ABC transporter permease [Sphaerochaetaceae bacterium]